MSHPCYELGLIEAELYAPREFFVFPRLRSRQSATNLLGVAPEPTFSEDNLIRLREDPV